jgi:hypothetical protein
VGNDSHIEFRHKLLGEGGSHGEATTSVFARVRGEVFSRFHAVAAKLRGRTGNYSPFGLLGPVFRATTTAV